MRVSTDRRRIVIDQAPPEAIVGAIPGARKYQGRWYAHATPVTAVSVVPAMERAKAAGHTVMMSASFAGLLEIARREQAAGWLRDAPLDKLPLKVGIGPEPWRDDPTAWVHQPQAFAWARERQASAIFVGMGGGKSRVAVALADEWNARVVLVLAPLGMTYGWPKQFRKHSDRGWRVWAGEARGASGRLLSNPSVAKKVATLRQLHAQTDAIGTPLAISVNYDVFWREPFRTFLLELADRSLIDVLIADESQRLKSPSSKTTQFAALLAPKVGRRILLTGTSMDDSPLDVYGQYLVLDPGVFGTSHASFLQRYAIMKDAPNPSGDGKRRAKIVDRLRPEAYTDLSARWHSQAFVREEKDLNLGTPGSRPPVDVYAPLQGDQAKVYAELDATYCAMVKGGQITAANAGVKLIRLQQVTSGHLPVHHPCPTCQPKDLPWVPTVEQAVKEMEHTSPDPWSPLEALASASIVHDVLTLAKGCRTCAGKGTVTRIETVGDAKRRALAGHLPDVPSGPVVMFCRFVYDLDVARGVADEVGRSYGEISGRNKDGLAIDATLQPGVTLLGCQIQSGGAGIDLTAAKFATYYSLGTSLGQHRQSEKRIDRPGQTQQVGYSHIISPGTVDRATQAALRGKADVVQTVMAAASAADVDWDDDERLEHAAAGVRDRSSVGDAS